MNLTLKFSMQELDALQHALNVAHAAFMSDLTVIRQNGPESLTEQFMHYALRCKQLKEKLAKAKREEGLEYA